MLRTFSVGTAMTNLIESIISMQTPFNMIVLIVLIGGIGGVITALASEVRKYMCHREEVDLKRELLASGMNATEIEQVVRATGPSAGLKNSSRSKMLA